MKEDEREAHGLEIPIIGSTDLFLWGPWASSKAEAFDEISACWDEEGRDPRHGPFNGRLANSLSVYSGSLNAKLRIVMQPVGTRPLLMPEEPEHPIALTQGPEYPNAQAPNWPPHCFTVFRVDAPKVSGRHKLRERIALGRRVSSSRCVGHVSWIFSAWRCVRLAEITHQKNAFRA